MSSLLVILAFGISLIILIALYVFSTVSYDISERDITFRWQAFNIFPVGKRKISFSSITEVRRFDWGKDKWGGDFIGNFKPQNWIVIETKYRLGMKKIISVENPDEVVDLIQNTIGTIIDKDSQKH